MELKELLTDPVAKDWALTILLLTIPFLFAALLFFYKKDQHRREEEIKAIKKTQQEIKDMINDSVKTQLQHKAELENKITLTDSKIKLLGTQIQTELNNMVKNIDHATRRIDLAMIEAIRK